VAGTRWSQSHASPRASQRGAPQANAPQGSRAGRRRHPRQPKSPYTISALAQRTGVPVPTIHYYRRLGLLPEPVVMAANRYLYDDRHVEVLAMIRLLRQERQMSLASIAEILPEFLPEEGEEEVFRSSMWDQVLAAYLDDVALSEPPARLVAAARRLFARDGFSGVTIADVCRAAGVATGSFYRHFQTKDAAFVAAVRSVADVLEAELDRLPSRLSSRRATAIMTELLEPFVPLLLESALRARRGSRELRGVTADVMRAIATSLDPHLRPSERSCERDERRARRVVHAAMIEHIDDALGLSPR
jgi:AcrR family transcriptional regulator